METIIGSLGQRFNELNAKISQFQQPLIRWGFTETALTHQRRAFYATSATTLAANIQILFDGFERGSDNKLDFGIYLSLNKLLECVFLVYALKDVLERSSLVDPASILKGLFYGFIAVETGMIAGSCLLIILPLLLVKGLLDCLRSQLD